MTWDTERRDGKRCILPDLQAHSLAPEGSGHPPVHQRVKHVALHRMREGALSVGTVEPVEHESFLSTFLADFVLGRREKRGGASTFSSMVVSCGCF